MTQRQKILSTAVGSTVAAVLVGSSAYLLYGLLHAPRIPSLEERPRTLFFQQVNVPIAELPWERSVDKPERPPRYIPMATVPRMPIHHDPAQPVRIFVRAAESPWTREVPEHPVVGVAKAHVPHLPVHRDLDRPEPVDGQTAQVPWMRSPESPAPASVAVAQLPTLHAKRDPQRPDSAQVPLADLPWKRDLHRPMPVDVPAAAIPNVLR